METMNPVIAVFDDHVTAESAVKKLIDAAFEMKKLSVVGRAILNRAKPFRLDVRSRASSAASNSHRIHVSS